MHHIYADFIFLNASTMVVMDDRFLTGDNLDDSGDTEFMSFLGVPLTNKACSLPDFLCIDKLKDKKYRKLVLEACNYFGKFLPFKHKFPNSPKTIAYDSSKNMMSIRNLLYKMHCRLPNKCLLIC